MSIGLTGIVIAYVLRKMMGIGKSKPSKEHQTWYNLLEQWGKL